MEKQEGLEGKIQDLATALSTLGGNQKCLGPADLLKELQQIFSGYEDVCHELLACFAEKLAGRADNITTQYELIAIAAKAISHKIVITTGI